MKKVMMIAALAAALVSCQSKGTQNNDAVAMDESVMAVTGNDSSAVAVYEGILPAADGPGTVSYTHLTLPTNSLV